MINEAIDEKSPYTGGHCQRVPQLTMMLAEAVNDTLDGPLSEFTMTEKDRYELQDRGPAPRLRQDHHAGPRRRQGDQARDDLRPHQPDRHPVRGAQARRRDRRAQQEARARARRRAGRDHPARPHLRDRRGAARHGAPDRGGPQVPAPLQHRRRVDVEGGAGPRRPDRARLQVARRDRQHRRLPHRRRAEEPHHLARHAHPGGARDHQPPHRLDDQDARGAAVAEAPAQRAGVRRRPPRAHGRQGLPARAHARPDVGARRG